MLFLSGGQLSRLVVLAALPIFLVGGCSSSAAYRARLSSSNPLERAKAVVALAEMGDRTAVHKLVDLLEDPDRAVRMYSILALTRLCGEDYGYRHYKPEAERDAAVQRWRDALRSGEVAIKAGPREGSGSTKPIEPSASGPVATSADKQRGGGSP